MAGAETPTILDYLNEDCWHAVLDYVPVRDIFRTERASRQWQQIVQVYLSGSRFGIGKAQRWRKLKVRWVEPSDVDRMLLDRIGPSVVAAYVDNKKGLNMIAKYCPNLKYVEFYKLKNKLLLNLAGNFQCLQELIFKDCCISDQCVRQYLVQNSLESLEIHIEDDYSVSDSEYEGWEYSRDSYKRKEHVTGECLVHPKAASLRTLVLESCNDLEFGQLLDATEYLQLTSFSLNYLSIEIFLKVHLVIEKLPTLESLHAWHSRVQDMKNDRFFASVCRLSRLTRLSVPFPPTDADVEEVARCCPQLRVLSLGYSKAVTGRGAAAACAIAGERLTSLGFIHSRLTDDDVVACIRGCPKLESLNLTFCKRITPGLLPRAAAARRETGARRPLWLCLMHIFDKDCQIDQKYEELNLVLK